MITFASLGLGSVVAQMLADTHVELRQQAEARAGYHVSSTAAGVSVARDGSNWLAPTSLGSAVQRLLQEVTVDHVQAATAAGHLVVHAAAVARGQSALLIPGASGAGKTTLTVELIRRHGFHLISDEAVVLDPSSVTALGFTRPVHIKAGSQHRWPELDPERHGLPCLPGGAWLVPSLIGGWQIAESKSRITQIVFPARTRGDECRLLSISQAEAAVRLGEQVSYLQGIPNALRKLAHVVAQVPAARLEYQDAQEAAVFVSSMIAAGGA